MSNWKWIYENFVTEKLDTLEEFSYEDFANMFLEPDKSLIDIYYNKVLDSLMNNPSFTNHCRKLKREFTQRNNTNSLFGASYQQYWSNRAEKAHQSNMNKRARDLESEVQKQVFKRVLRSVAREDSSISSDHSNTRHTEDETATSTIWPKIKTILEDTTEVPTCCLSSLNILDFTNKCVVRLARSRLLKEEYSTIEEQIKIKDWIPDASEEQLLSAINKCNPSYRAIRKAIRSSSISPETFDAYIHHSILTIEAVLTNFLDTLEFGGSFNNEKYERTCASAVVVPIFRQLFKRHNNISVKWFEIQSKFTINHQFDAILFYQKLNEPVGLAEFGSPACHDQKVENDTVKVYRNAHRVLNELASKTKTNHIPTVFVVLFHQATLLFETLQLTDNLTYVRACHAKIPIPTSPDSLITIAAEMGKIFAWRDALVTNITQLYNDRSQSSSPDTSYDTLDVCNTP